MTSVTSGLVDHVNQDPPEVDRANPERRDSSGVAERLEPSNRLATSLAGRCVEREDPIDGVDRRQAYRVVGVVGSGPIPWSRHLQPEEPALEPPILCPCQVLHDPRDGHVRRRQETSRGLLPGNADECPRRDRPVLVETLKQRCALVLGPEVRIRGWVDRHEPILTPPATESVTNAGSAAQLKCRPVGVLVAPRQGYVSRPRFPVRLAFCAPEPAVGAPLPPIQSGCRSDRPTASSTRRTESRGPPSHWRASPETTASTFSTALAT